jgi:hypothetical protein
VNITATGLLTETEHGPELCYGSRTHCVWHNLDEISVEPYRICLECNHVFATVAALVSAYNDAMRKMWVWGVMVFGTNDDSEIYSCPFCSHDW